MDRKFLNGQQPGPNPELDSEVVTLARYLSDEVPPMLVADAIDRLSAAPGVVLATIQTWVGNQYSQANPLPVMDYLFHAAKKLHLLVEFELVDQDRLQTLLISLYPLMLEVCPEGDRAGLAKNLRAIGHEKSLLSSPVEVVHRPAGSGVEHQTTVAPGGAATGTDGSGPRVETSRIVDGLERLNVLLDRFELPAGETVKGVAEPDQRQAVLTEILGELTASSRSEMQFRSQLDLLGNLGVTGSGHELLQLLSRSLPDWVQPAGGETEAAPVETMKRVVGLASTSGETRKRFYEFVDVAVHEFNDGNLGRAATLFRNAEKMVESGDVESSISRGVKGQIYNRLDQERLRRELESEHNYRALRDVLVFFPQVSVPELLLELEVEQKRDRRRFIISLLCAHGQPARLAALVNLSDSMSGRRNLSWYVERNLIHLLVSVPRGEGQEPSPSEIEVLGHYSEVEGQFPLVREAFRLLGTTPGPRSEAIAVARVGEVEQALLGIRDTIHTVEELQGLVDTLVKDLARRDTPAAWRCVVGHSLKRKAVLGDTLGRLAELGRHDLANEPAIVELIVDRLQSELPVRLFGVTVAGKRRSENVKRLIAALSGTDSPAVRGALARTIEQFDGQDLAEVAKHALQQIDSTPDIPGEDEEGAAVSGDLALFGLPNLLQNLADSCLTGTLSIQNRAEGGTAAVDLVDGRLGDARYGNLEGESAIYQLLQKPLVGTFSFSSHGVSDGESGIELVSVLLEGMRRYDELTRATALVPDGARLETAGVKPNLPSSDVSRELAKAVWEKAGSGATALECEAVAAVDSYQVRSLLAHWVDQGALKHLTS